MATINERYSAAVHSRSLRVDEKTAMSDTDVLGAMGLADRRLTDGWVTTGPDGAGYDIKPAPLAASLERLFCGDNNAAHAIVRTLAQMVFERSFTLNVKLTRTQAEDIAKACLAWHRNGTCKKCGGHGKQKIKGSPTLDENSNCPACYDGVLRYSTGKIPFVKQFRHEWVELAGWLVDQMTREAGKAGPQAMRALAPKLDL